MEMHQVRYFLATVSELNFTKAAEKCNVSQPSLTRAIKQLEAEVAHFRDRAARAEKWLQQIAQHTMQQNMCRFVEEGEPQMVVRFVTKT